MDSAAGRTCRRARDCVPRLSAGDVAVGAVIQLDHDCFSSRGIHDRAEIEEHKVASRSPPAAPRMLFISAHTLVTSKTPTGTTITGGLVVSWGRIHTLFEPSAPTPSLIIENVILLVVSVSVPVEAEFWLYPA